MLVFGIYKRFNKDFFFQICTHTCIFSKNPTVDLKIFITFQQRNRDFKK